ncbi:membrane-associated protein, putative [Bodo saltans]|uniref:Membrane-associated protein, putative n=1 Tax=Bodo saltans TaxID=75058 RepID=A0A0S4J4B7_BODSA|nr:membrane-associated protein, putative [Bodo saltans]|eukprot:CUG68041.1 membrane-associated protein, putative [Bodo saltans]
MSATYRLAAIGLLFVALVLSIVAASTHSWIVVSDVHFGLFWICSGGSCVNTLDALAGGNNDCRSKDQAAQAFIVVGIILLFFLFFLVVIRRDFASNSLGNAVVRNVPLVVDLILAVLIVTSLVIAWACVAAMYNECICNYSSPSCGLNYSWALTLIASFAVMVVTVLLFLSKESSNS